MKAITHAALAVTSTAAFLGTTNPIILILSALCSQFPDVDTSKSVTGRLLFPISTRLESRFPHRSITHSFIATAIFAVVTLPIALISGTAWVATLIGYFMGWFGDVFTKNGVAAFYPSQARLVIPGNPRFRLTTNSPAEAVVFCILIAICLIALNINSQGGIVIAFNQLLGLPEGVIEEILADGQRHLLYVEIIGKDNNTQQSIRDRFEVIQALTANDILVQSQGGVLYRAGSSQNAQIRVSRIRLFRGDEITSNTEQVRLEMETITDLELESRPERTYLTGTLFVEDTEDITIVPFADRYNPISFQPTQGASGIVRIKAARPQDVAVIQDAEMTGNILIRSIETQ